MESITPTVSELGEQVNFPHKVCRMNVLREWGVGLQQLIQHIFDCNHKMTCISQNYNISILFAEVWVLGDSTVRWAGERAKQNSAKFADRSITWDGRSGMKVQDLHSAIQYGILKGYKPKMIVVHLGGNNLSSSNTCQIISILKKSLDYLFSVFSSTLIVWTFILPRLNWRNTPNTSASAKTMDL